MLTLKLQYVDYLMQSTDSLEKTVILGKSECKTKVAKERLWKLKLE